MSSKDLTNEFISDDQWAKEFQRLYDGVMAMPQSSYSVNQVQMDKLIEVLSFFIEVSDMLDGEIEPLELNPAEVVGDVVATFTVFDLSGNMVQKFSKILQHASALSIDAPVDGVRISITIPNVFVPANRQ